MTTNQTPTTTPECNVISLDSKVKWREIERKEVSRLKAYKDGITKVMTL